MNQILFRKNYDQKKINKLKIQLLLSLLIIFSIGIYVFLFYKNLETNEKLSDNLLNTFNIEKLYSSNTQEYNITKFNSSDNIFIIGIIEIPKIGITYPIFSEVNDDLLKISPCRFYGSFPNEIGNLCIAAHNYNDNRFFGNLYKLDINDKINIYDINNFCVTYSVYNKFELPHSDTSCTSQNTNNKKELTLVTCNNINKNKLIIKASE